MATKTQKYLRVFFEEKDLPYADWDITSTDGTWNSISNEFVIEMIHVAPRSEQEGIANMIRKIDFLNGNVNDYLKHLAHALVG